MCFIPLTYLRYAEAPKVYTKFGNRLGPGYKYMLQWISECWTELDPEVIIHSFACSGLGSFDPESYHHTLKNIVLNEVMPPGEVSISICIFISFRIFNNTRLIILM